MCRSSVLACPPQSRMIALMTDGQSIDNTSARKSLGSAHTTKMTFAVKSWICVLVLVDLLWWKRARVGRSEVEVLRTHVLVGSLTRAVTKWLEKHHVGGQAQTGKHWSCVTGSDKL